MRRKVWLATGVGGLLLAVGVFVIANLDTFTAAAVLRDASSPPADLADRVAHRTVTITDELDGAMYRPSDVDGPLPGFVVVHGAIGLGPDDPRFVALAQALASQGATVLAPRLSSLAQFRVDAEDPSRIGASVKWLADQPTVVDGQVSILGISIGGSYSLLAAGDPSVEERLNAVLVFGGHYDLEALLTRWLTDPVETPTVLDPLTEGRRLVMLGNVDAVVAPDEAEVVADCLRALLDDRLCTISQPLGPTAQVLVESARSDSPLDEVAAATLLEPLKGDLAALSPAGLSDAPGVPIHLLHAEGDPVVPTEDSVQLAALLEGLGAVPRLAVTDVFEHVDTESNPSLIAAWPLIRFVGDYLSQAGM